MDEDLLKIVAHIVLFVACAVVGWLFGGAGVYHKPESGITVLRFGVVLRGLAVLSLAFSTVLAAWTVVEMCSGNVDLSGLLLAVTIAPSYFLLSICIYLETFRTQVALDPVGITKQSWFGRLTIIEWQEIERVTNWESLGAYIVRGADKRIWVSHYVEGIDDFSKECQQRLPGQVYGRAFVKPPMRFF